MTAAQEQPPTHADRHDLDKLTRWKANLDAADKSAAAANPFPVCAIFLVAPENRAAHNIFRRYRTLFEELGAGFHHLVIFGQHGKSTTLSEFLYQLGASPADVPLLALAPTDAADAGRVVRLPLPQGEQDGDLDESQPWGAALTLIRAAASKPAPLILPNVGAGAFRRGTLNDAVDAALRKLNGNPA